MSIVTTEQISTDLLTSSDDNIDKNVNRVIDNNKSICKIAKINEVYQPWIIWNWCKDGVIESIESKIFDSLDANFDRKYVYINNGSQRIWTVSTNTNFTNKTPLVLIHGFCGSIGLWAHNIDKLCKNRPLYAFDVLGFGRSSRPKFSDDPVKAEEEFIDSIDDWRKQLGINQMILLGHSFGGFLSTSYALKYPQYVKALILADPWGFSVRNINIQYPMWIKIVIKLAQYMSPFSMIRATGPIGVSLFKRLRPDFRVKFYDIFGNSDLIYEYIYHSNRQIPSGEYGFRAVADQIRYAKYPMIKRIENLDANIPIWFIYGSKSWIDKDAGLEVKRLRENAYVSVKMIHQAGHHVYADQPQVFNEHVEEILESIDVVKK